MAHRVAPWRPGTAEGIRHQSDLWCGGTVGFACSGGDSDPSAYSLIERSGPLVLVANACLDDRDALVRRLGVQRLAAAGLSDAALILRAYERWGERCPAHLDGAFAFALWDRRRHTLFCARDPFGLRPLYYVKTGAFFAFASRIEGLLALPGVPRRLNEAAVADYLMEMAEDKESTFYEGVLRLPPGHTLTAAPTALHLRPYWSPDPHTELRLRRGLQRGVPRAVLQRHPSPPSRH